MIDYSDFRHECHADWEAGRQDASQTNPYRNDGDRTGEALAAYESGWEYGEECMRDYYESQD